MCLEAIGVKPTAAYSLPPDSVFVFERERERFGLFWGFYADPMAVESSYMLFPHENLFQDMMSFHGTEIADVYWAENVTVPDFDFVDAEIFEPSLPPPLLLPPVEFAEEVVRSRNNGFNVDTEIDLIQESSSPSRNSSSINISNLYSSSSSSSSSNSSSSPSSGLFCYSKDNEMQSLVSGGRGGGGSESSLNNQCENKSKNPMLQSCKLGMELMSEDCVGPLPVHVRRSSSSLIERSPSNNELKQIMPPLFLPGFNDSSLYPQFPLSMRIKSEPNNTLQAYPPVIQTLHNKPTFSSIRRLFSTGDIKFMNDIQMGNRCGRPLNASLEEAGYKVGRYTVEERKQRIYRYKMKRTERNFNKKIKYACRKTLADSRPRVRGRFARNEEAHNSKIRKSTGRQTHQDEYEEMDSLQDDYDRGAMAKNKHSRLLHSQANGFLQKF